MAAVRRLLQLVGEIREIEDVLNKKRHAVQCLRQLVGAELSVMLVDSDFGPGRRGLVTEFVADGYPDWLTRSMIQQYVELGSVADPAVAAMMERPEPIIVGARREFCEDDVWYKNSFVNEVRHAARLDDSLFAMRCASPGVSEGICLTRALGDRPFSEEDRNLVELFLTECSQLFRPPLSAGVSARYRALPPRHRRVLDNLLSGLTEKSIAQRQGLSTHTVHQYVKELYKTFEVKSRAELLALCLSKRG